MAQTNAVAPLVMQMFPVQFEKPISRIEDDEDFADIESEAPATTPTMTVQNSVTSWNINPVLAKNLIDESIVEFFPVQRAVIPALLRHNSRKCVQPRDICVSAPTGSGKTAGYCVPIINILASRAAPTTQLRALFLLPSRELASQVFTVFCRLSRNLNVSAILSTGQTPFMEEHHALVGPTTVESSDIFDMGISDDQNVMLEKNIFSNQDLYTERSRKAVKSAVDVLICTPGRLLEHLQFRGGLSLQHLRFLVLDEADRLLGNAYHTWVRTLFQSIHSTSGTEGLSLRRHQSERSFIHESNHTNGEYFLPMKPPLQRLLFSATLTDNPRKLALLGVRNPIVIRSTSADARGVSAESGPGDERLSIAAGAGDGDAENEAPRRSTLAPSAPSMTGFTLPAHLSESMCVCDTTRRPLVLAGFLYEACHDVAPPLTGHAGIDKLEQQGEENDSESESEDNGDDAGGKSGRSSEKRMRVNSEAPDAVTNGAYKHQGQGHGGVCGGAGGLCLVFTSSVESTHRLCRLLQLMNVQQQQQQQEGEEEGERAAAPPGGKRKRVVSEEGDGQFLFGGPVVEMSRLMRSEARMEIMRKARAGHIKVLVSSDQMARGIDLPNINLVINYDPPSFAKVYVHRAGRTARANRPGHCLTLLKVGQGGGFRKMRSTIASGHAMAQSIESEGGKVKIPKATSRKSTESRIQPYYSRALSKLNQVLEMEEQGELQADDDISHLILHEGDE